MKARVTIEYLEPTPEGVMTPARTLEFEGLTILQDRRVQRVKTTEGQTTLVPSPTTTTTLVGTQTTPPA